MTSDKHDRATDRTAEALLKIEENESTKYDIIIMLQGDEPMVTPEMIENSIKPFNDKSVNVTNLMAKISNKKDFNDPNEVKVVCDNNDDALYFSREPIPSLSKSSNHNLMMKQVCVIPFRRDYLLKFNQMEESRFEKIESIDMLRILENGEKVRMIEITEETNSVDTLEELKIVEKKMKNDKLIKKYVSL